MVIARPNVPRPPAGYVKQKRVERRIEAPKQAEMTRQEEYSHYPPDSCPSLCRPCDAACCCCMNCLFEAPVGIACAAGCSPGGLFCCTPVSLICDAVIKCACCCGDPNDRLWDFFTLVIPPSLIHHGTARYVPYLTMYTGVLAAGRFWYPLTANPSWPAITPWVYTLNKLAPCQVVMMTSRSSSVAPMCLVLGRRRRRSGSTGPAARARLSGQGMAGGSQRRRRSRLCLIEATPRVRTPRRGRSAWRRLA